jgi:hypothetical protein
MPGKRVSKRCRTLAMKASKAASRALESRMIAGLEAAWDACDFLAGTVVVGLGLFDTFVAVTQFLEFDFMYSLRQWILKLRLLGLVFFELTHTQLDEISRSRSRSTIARMGFPKASFSLIRS